MNGVNRVPKPLPDTVPSTEPKPPYSEKTANGADRKKTATSSTAFDPSNMMCLKYVNCCFIILCTLLS